MKFCGMSASDFYEVESLSLHTNVVTMRAHDLRYCVVPIRQMRR